MSDSVTEPPGQLGWGRADASNAGLVPLGDFNESIAGPGAVKKMPSAGIDDTTGDIHPSAANSASASTTPATTSTV
jgi:hypothetical protein